MTEQPIPDKSISDQLESVLAQLSTDQIRFVVARQEFATDTEAAEAIGIKRDTVYHWPPVVKEAVRLMANDGIVTALYLRRRALAKAMLIKVKGLDTSDPRLRQSVATEIIEWEMGRATQPIETTPDDPRNEVARLLDRLAASGTEDGADSGDER